MSNAMSPREKAYTLLEDIHSNVYLNKELLEKISNNLNEASYTMSEAYLWPDDVHSVSPKQIILCYKIVQYLINNDGILDPKFKL